MALLEPSPGSIKLAYEMLYVMSSRVKEASKFRCLPLSLSFDKSTLTRLRPEIGAVKWRMDISEDGYWKQRDTGNISQSGKRFVSSRRASFHLVSSENTSFLPIVNNTNSSDVSSVMVFHTAQVEGNDGYLFLNRFVWHENSCALDWTTHILQYSYRHLSLGAT